jgi:hypothetical protein
VCATCRVGTCTEELTVGTQLAAGFSVTEQRQEFFRMNLPGKNDNDPV